MSELVIPVATVGIGAISGAVGVYVIAKKYVNHDKMCDILDGLLDEVAHNKEMQEKIAVLGVVLGAGIRQGIGLNTKGGKLKLTDIALSTAQQFLPGILGKLFGASAQSGEPQQQTGQELVGVLG